MALNANALIDFATLQVLTGRESSEQAKYEALINVASSAFERYTGRHLAQATYTNVVGDYQGGSGVLMLPDFPVSSISALNIDGSGAFAAATLVPAFASGKGYKLDQSIGRITLFGYSVPDGLGVWQASYVAGYAINTCPSDLQYAVLEYTTWLAARLSSRTPGERFTSLDGMNVSFEIDIPQHVRSILDGYCAP